MGKTNNILKYLPDFLDRRSNNRDFITSFDEDYQLAEDNIIILKTDIQLSTASGSSLDNIGLLFDLRRLDGESDFLYRGRIKSFWNANKGGGTEKNLIDAISPILNIDSDKIKINIEEKTEFKGLVDGTFTTTDWALEDEGANLSLSSTDWYEGISSIQFDGSVGDTFSVAKTFPVLQDFSRYLQHLFSVNVKIPSLIKFIRTEISIYDNLANYVTFYNEQKTTDWLNILLDLNNTPADSLGDIQWVSIQKVTIRFIYDN